MRTLAALCAVVSLAAQAGEVTVIRPSAFIGADSPYYVMVDGRLARDIESREHVRFGVAPGHHVLAVRCPKFGAYAESRREQDFGAGPAIFVIEPKFDCVTITPVDARAAAPLLANSRLRPDDKPSTYTAGDVVRSSADAAPAPPKAALPIDRAPSTNVAANDEVSSATAAWVEAFNSRDPARIVSLYEPDAVLIGTTAKKPASGTAAIAAYFANAPKQPMNRVALGEHAVRVFGDMAVDSGLYNFFQVSEGNAQLVPARYTFVYRKRDGQWRIVEHHSSRVP